MGNLLAGATGGAAINAGSSGDVSAAIVTAVDQVAANPRSPQRTVASIFPPFDLVDHDTDAMSNAPSRITVEIERNTAKGKSVPFRTDTVAGTASTAILPGPLPIGSNRWRLGLNYKAGGILSPDRTTLDTVAGGKSVEGAYTEFNRILATPQPPSVISPVCLTRPSPRKRLLANVHRGSDRHSSDRSPDAAP